MSKKEHSAVDAIYIILEEIKELKNKIELVDSNLKELSNKIYVLNSRVSKLKNIKDTSENLTSDKLPAAQPVENNYTSNVKVQENSGLFLGKIKLYGYIKNTEKIPIGGVRVELFKEGEKIRELKTNKDGYWEVRFPSGQYKVTYTLRGYKPVSKIINLLDNIKEYEVE